MRIGYINDWTDSASLKVQIIDETINKEQFVKDLAGLMKSWESCHFDQRYNQVMKLFDNSGKYILKEMPIKNVRADGSWYFADSMTGIFLRDKNEVKDICEE